MTTSPDNTANVTRAQLDAKIKHERMLVMSRGALIKHLHIYASRYQTEAECAVAADYIMGDVKQLCSRACECGEDAEALELRILKFICLTRGDIPGDTEVT